MPPRHTITLPHANDWPAFRQAARALVQAGVPPDAVEWYVADDAAQDLFADAGPDLADARAAHPAHGSLWDMVEAEAMPAPTTDFVAPPFNASPLPETPGLPHLDSASWGAAYGAAAIAAGQPTAAAGSVEAVGMLGADAPSQPLRVPAEFVRQCEQLMLHRDPARLALMYRLLWRLAHEPGLRRDPLDPDRLRAQRMARAVSRDMHKMHAFVRFRPVPQADGSTLHMAWFEPDHRITAATAGFFVRRFTQMQWVILAPDATVHWDGSAQHTGPGAQRSDAPAPDAGEALWLTYYRSTFNPARLKLDMMRKEMPQRYWKNLPEASLITELAHSAHERTTRMVEAPATTPRRRIAAPPPTLSPPVPPG